MLPCHCGELPSKRKQRIYYCFRLGMGECTELSDSDSKFIDGTEGSMESRCLEPTNCKKKLKLSFTKPKKNATADKENVAGAHIDFVNKAKAETLSKKIVTSNTVTSTKWCDLTFTLWQNNRFQEEAQDQVPTDLLESSDAALITKWLTLYMAEVRKKDVRRYPQKKCVYASNGSLVPHAVTQSKMSKLFRHK